ncbi:hypothetical protein [Ponticoccus alexandrii]|nr:hypothetical protein [Ponticoccus alexandrii]
MALIAMLKGGPGPDHAQAKAIAAHRMAESDKHACDGRRPA